LRGLDGPRITGGTAKGRRLFSVPGLDVRPALARMRVSVFEILRSRLDGARVVDLFAGTGCLGLEALSRGAASAVFCDVDRRSLDCLRMNVERLGFSDRADVRAVDAFRAAESVGPCDLVFVDPPYDFYVDRREAMAGLVSTLLSKALAPGGRVLSEHRLRQGLGELPGARIDDERAYGETVVTFYAASV
jgi:16S rRNA (guanine966-N2)-methyltransferase